MVRNTAAYTDMVLEKELRVLHLNLQASGSELSHTEHALSIYEISKPIPTVTYFL